MFKILDEFIENKANTRLIQYTGALAALCGIFLAIPTSTIQEVKTALTDIQLFWLTLLTFTLTSLFIRFIKYVWHTEKKLLASYGSPITGAFTLFIGAILAAVIINLWAYMGLTYSDTIAAFIISIGFPATITIRIRNNS